MLEDIIEFAKALNCTLRPLDTTQIRQTLWQAKDVEHPFRCRAYSTEVVSQLQSDGMETFTRFPYNIPILSTPLFLFPFLVKALNPLHGK